MGLASQRTTRFRRPLRGVYRDSLQRSASRTCTQRHFRKRWALGLSVDGLRNNIEKLQAAKAQRSSRFPVVYFTYVLMRSNIRERPEFVEFAQGLDDQGLAAMHLTPFEGLHLTEESLSHDKELCNRMLDEAEQLASGYGIPFAFPPRFSDHANIAPLAEDVPEGFQLNVAGKRATQGNLPNVPRGGHGERR